MWPDQVSNSGSLALESDALSTALRGSSGSIGVRTSTKHDFICRAF